MEKKEKGNSSKFLVVDSLLPSIVDKEKKKKGSAKIENEKRKWTGTGSEQAGEEEGRGTEKSIAFFGNPRAACV